MSPEPHVPQLTHPATYAMVQRCREVVWAADNASDRSQQTQIGPSEIGSTCERRIAYKTLNHPQVNHDADHWAAIVGTSVHAWLAKAYERADNGTGRYLIEYQVYYITPSGLVVPGHLDVYDRLYHEVIDHKCVGSESARHYKVDGSPLQYIVQGNIYALALEQMGERPERVGQMYYPRDGKLKEDSFGYSDAYNPRMATDAIARLDRIQQTVTAITDNGNLPENIGYIPKTPTRLCSWCPYYMPDSPNPALGCNGKKDE